MKTLMKSSSLLLVVFLVSGGLRAQSVDDIVGKYVDAIGGQKVVSGVNSIVLESNVSVMGNDIPSNTTILNGKGFKSETDFNGSKIVTCITDKGGWAINPMAGQTTATALPAEQFNATKGAYQVGGPLVNYASKGYKVEMAGKDSTDYQLKVTASGGVTIVYYVNTSTYLIDKMVNKMSVNGQDIEITTTYKDYKKTDNGFVMPYSQEVNYPQYTIAITHTKVEINKAVDPAIFDMPK